MKIVNYTVLLHKEFEIPTLQSKLLEILKFVFLSDVAHMSFYVKFSGLRSKLRILKNIVLTSADIQRTDLWCANEAFRITNFTSKTKHFTALLFFLAVCNKKFQRANAQPYAQARTQLVDSLFCITCSLKSNASSLLH